MATQVEAPKIDLEKMSLEQRANFDAEVAKLTPVETPEAKAAREEQERQSRIEVERRNQICRAFALKHADDFQPCDFNGQALAKELEGQTLTLEALETAFVKLTREGKLLPPAFKEPAPPVDPPFDYKGLTLAALKAMPRNEYKSKLADPVYSRIIQQIVQDHNEGKS
jgi:hypothetical protein